MRFPGYLPSILFLGILAVSPAWLPAQNSGQNPGTGSSTTPPPQSSSDKPAPTEKLRRIILTGSVMMEDGSPPPAGAGIELDCGGRVNRAAMVGVNGSYSFELGNTRDSIGSTLPDASMRTADDIYDDVRMGDIDNPPTSFNTRQMTPAYQRLGACDLRAQLSGYQSTSVRIQMNSLTMVNHIGPLFLYPSGAIKGTAMSATTLLAPKKAKKSLEKAVKAFDAGKLAESETETKSAIQLYPEYAEAWAHLGFLYRKQQRNEEAREALKRAIAADEKYVNPYVQLAWVESREQKWPEAAELTEKALALDPIHLTDAHFLSALANHNLRNLELAENRAKQTVRLDTGHLFPRVHLILASIAAGRDDHNGAIMEMRNYLQYAPEAPDAQSVREKLQEEERLAKSGTSNERQVE